MSSAFNTALSALNATSTAINVVGNNLANLNTTGYKASEVSFYDMVTEASAGSSGTTAVGMGTAAPMAFAQFTQGGVESTGGPLDAAIQGDGFFVVQDPSTGATLYTRAGNFQQDANGNLITSTGQNVQGWTASNGVLNTSGAPGNIQIPSGDLLAPIPTSQMSLAMNLNADGTAGGANGTFQYPIQAVDSLGNPLTLTVTFSKDATNPLQWDYQVSIPGDATTGGTAGTPTDLLSTPGALTFDSSGNLVTPASTDASPTLAITGLSDGAADMNITWSLYNSNGTPMITQYSQASAVSSSSQDGEAAGELTSVGISNGGEIMADYSNGKQIAVAQLALANISNPDSLVSAGNNNFQTSVTSALPAIGVAGTGGRGKVVGQSLESSNADVATEFTHLIVYQRAYEANSKVVTTADQLSQDTIAMITA